MHRTLFSYGVCEDGYCNYSYRSWSEHASSKKIDNGGNATCLKTVFIFAVSFVAKSCTSPLISREHVCEIPPGSERSQRVQGVKKICWPPPPRSSVLSVRRKGSIQTVLLGGDHSAVLRKKSCHSVSIWNCWCYVKYQGCDCSTQSGESCWGRK